jgi:cytochrome c biogenesis protein CcdA
MLTLAAVIFAIALADSVNPATVAPALYLATVERPVRRIAEFAAGFALVNVAGGLVIVAGPGQLLISLASRPSPAARHVVELAAGLGLITLGAILFRGQARLAREHEPAGRLRGGHAWAFGATIAAAELPTALPYFAALAIVVGSGFGIARQLVLVGWFNIVFLAPVGAIALVVAAGGEAAKRPLRRAGDWLRRRWPIMVGGLALAAGFALFAYGLARLLGG